MSSLRTIRTEEAFVGSTMALAELAINMSFCMEGDPSMFQADADGVKAAMVDAYSNPVFRPEPGQVVFYPHGSSPPVIVGTNVPGQQFDSTDANLLRRMARGARVPFSAYSADSSRTTFSSMRGEALNARKDYKPMQRFVWEHHTEPYRRRLIDWAIFTGRIELTPQQRALFADPISRERLYKCSPGYPGWDYVNPAQESMAAATNIESGVKSPIDVIIVRGGTVDNVIAGIIKYELKLKAARKEAGLEDKAPAPPTPPTDGGDNAKNPDDPSKTDGGDAPEEDGNGRRTPTGQTHRGRWTGRLRGMVGQGFGGEREQ
jgi:hypothetical protein